MYGDIGSENVIADAVYQTIVNVSEFGCMCGIMGFERFNPVGNLPIWIKKDRSVLKY